MQIGVRHVYRTMPILVLLKCYWSFPFPTFGFIQFSTWLWNWYTRKRLEWNLPPIYWCLYLYGLLQATFFSSIQVCLHLFFIKCQLFVLIKMFTFPSPNQPTLICLLLNQEIWTKSVHFLNSMTIMIFGIFCLPSAYSYHSWFCWL